LNAPLPRLTIGMPVYNGERFLDRAISSVLGQDFADFELIISDNGSDDATPEICRAYAARDPRIRYHRSDVNRGAAWNFSRVLELASGEYFKWAAHDDWYAPDFLSRCIAVLDDDPASVLCCSPMVVLDDEDRELRVHRDDLDGATSPHLAKRFHAMLWSVQDPTNLAFGVYRTEALKPIGYRNIPEPDRTLLGELVLQGSFRQLDEALYFRHAPPGHWERRNQWLWLDPANANRRPLATARIAAAYARAVARADASTATKTRMWADLAAAMVIARTRGKIRSILNRRALRKAGVLKPTEETS
jgi:glycosyltransferase involved in cell wall biosynthesis